MVDNLTKEQRSYCMSRIRSKDTSVEKVVRSRLHKLGLRFRKHVSSLPGKPDIVFVKSKVVVFIDGDFWHGWRFPLWKDSLSLAWQQKIERNRVRSNKHFRRLRYMGWKVIRVWEHEVNRDLDRVVERIKEALDESNVV